MEGAAGWELLPWARPCSRSARREGKRAEKGHPPCASCCHITPWWLPGEEPVSWCQVGWRRSGQNLLLASRTILPTWQRWGCATVPSRDQVNLGERGTDAGQRARQPNSSLPEGCCVESRNCWGWKRSLRLSGAILKPAVPNPALHRVPEHHINTSFGILWMLQAGESRVL